ncbi:HAMP domain-containing histidine kinase [Paenibacillus sp. HN-1]|uniref:sensor histidine kinase n=1 Tax=Paenibacillus TaxID=44249 RepID=UPI001CA86CF7|nr:MULTISPECIES: HAMP domain-containing sensor histidine kinase [Paenibacillus]MBY9077906.1 HAMP domain-containing histidine kinase [Paenibacillus sp. CGMCC 1.18879]MBY9088138.1 HAMP domain-containing histidine kinase [Paenibacillus sinensis]
MFDKLRNRFLIVNLVTISLIMLVAFASIYIIMYQNVRADIDMELHRSADSPQKSPGQRDGGSPGQPDQGSPSGGGGPTDGGSGGGGGQAFERSVAFTVQTDKTYEITTTKAPFDMDASLYPQALQEALSMKKDTGSFSLDGSKWTYLKQPNAEGYIFVFLDTSDRQDILTKLIYTFAAVGMVMLVVLYFTSRYFANRSIKPVKEAFEKQKQFIGDASHELKTPLAIINTNADVLLANSEDTIRNQSKWLNYIKSEAERMSRLTSDLLYLTEMDDSRTRMMVREFNMSEATENTILTMEAVIFEKQLSLDYDIEPGLMVRGSSEQIQQVLMILLDNAVKYVNPHGSINLTLKKAHNGILLSVSNTGAGIAPEHLTRIFDRFYRTDASRTRKQGGYGLGLAIAKSIVEQHKGKIYAKSIVGESTTFYVQLY